MRIVRVALKERSYPVLIGRGLLARTGALLRRHAKGFGRSVIVVTQAPVAAVYRSVLCDSLSREGFSVSVFTAPFTKSSEESKSQSVLSELIRHIVSCDGKNDRPSLVALGGGVVGDLTGFAASVYRRGIAYAQVPTTLVAQVDSAIGGKTAVDLPEGKNLLGTIYQPSIVLSDVTTLASLPDRTFCEGFAEAIKYGVIKDTGLFRSLDENSSSKLRSDTRMLEKIVARCAKIKAKVVERDEHDKKGVRIALNFGHTAAHAIETASRYAGRYTHGEAVAIGMLIACDIASALGVLKEAELTAKLEHALIRYNLPLYFKAVHLEAVMKAMGYDKKAEGGRNRFVLPVALGKTAIVEEIPSETILAALNRRKQ